MNTYPTYFGVPDVPPHEPFNGTAISSELTTSNLNKHHFAQCYSEDVCNQP